MFLIGFSRLGTMFVTHITTQIKENNVRIVLYSVIRASREKYGFPWFCPVNPALICLKLEFLGATLEIRF